MHIVLRIFMRDSMSIGAGLDVSGGAENDPPDLDLPADRSHYLGCDTILCGHSQRDQRANLRQNELRKMSLD
jgi:hypothetical protein